MTKLKKTSFRLKFWLGSIPLNPTLEKPDVKEIVQELEW